MLECRAAGLQKVSSRTSRSRRDVAPAQAQGFQLAEAFRSNCLLQLGHVSRILEKVLVAFQVQYAQGAGLQQTSQGLCLQEPASAETKLLQLWQPWRNDGRHESHHLVAVPQVHVGEAKRPKRSGARQKASKAFPTQLGEPGLAVEVQGEASAGQGFPQVAPTKNEGVAVEGVLGFNGFWLLVLHLDPKTKYVKSRPQTSENWGPGKDYLRPKSV